MPADKLILNGLTVYCSIGTTEQERSSLQPIWIDVELPIDAAKAAASQRLADTLDYAALADAIRRFGESRSFQLLETLAESTARLISQQFGARRVWLRVRKRAFYGLDFAAVEIVRDYP